jgi:hypothetical protein
VQPLFRAGGGQYGALQASSCGKFQQKLGNNAHFNRPFANESQKSTGTARAIHFSVNLRLKGGDSNENTTGY